MKLEDVVRKKQEKEEPKGIAREVLRALKRGSVSVSELSSRLDHGVSQIRNAIDELEASGYHLAVKAEAVEVVRDLPSGGELRIDPKRYRGNEYEFGVVSDTHLASKYCRLDVLNALYDIFAAEGIKDIFHAGNIVDGEGRFNRFDLLAVGTEGQIDLAIRDYPKRKGITTNFIVGECHEGWWVQREGINIGKLIDARFRDAGRTDVNYLGYLEADIQLPAPKGTTWIRLMHPGGGSAYALSYAPQKIVESFQGGEKPHALIIGHFHKMEFCMPREVYCVSAGCTQDQTPFMRKLRLEAHLGGWTCKITQARDGHISSMAVNWHRFYDRKFYHGKEKFPRW